MLTGLDMESNSSRKSSRRKNIEIVYEDDVLAMINKPAEFLSVPGKSFPIRSIKE